MKIGRTSENDLVLHDHGVSRRHARIVERGGLYFAEDVGSANGTSLNGALIPGEQQLRDGDRITVGPVEFTFVWVPPEGDEDATRPIRRNMPVGGLFDAVAEVQPTAKLPAIAPQRPVDSPPPPPVKVAAPPVLAPAADLDEAPEKTLLEIAPVLAPPASYADEAPEKTLLEIAPVLAPLVLPEEKTASAAPELAPAPLVLPEEVPEEKTTPALRFTLAPPVVPEEGTAPALKPAPASPAAPTEGATAAERARRRRELASSGGGQLALWWTEQPLGARLAVALPVVLLLVGGLVTLGWVFLPHEGSAGPKGPEPVSLGVDPVTDSFGLGEGVQWERPDQKSFDFEFVTPTRAVALLHYQASGISKEEVALVLNGVNLGWVPPDTASANERELEAILPVLTLKRNEHNSVVFDNVRNPPGNESWRVWNLRLEIIPVPELSRDDLVAKARQYAVAGARFYETRDIGAENLFKAWKEFRFAWITLEALDEKPELYQDVRYQLGQVSAELDHKCSQLMLDFQRAVQYRNAKKARAALQEVGRRFPTAEHRCHNRALELAYEHEL
ncbi:FHA domain-containing protein [Pyxidicoccus parkwaysis]|uniref:FHA domain-containing protein n=1 Tax=Pyxidicoccus parkwayensis TaxID=2813578 RepID=UPI001F50E564|nr:FHA domain-containing protein [Pyxidicoccus parkwaysis]